jgi:hypothetical protein
MDCGVPYILEIVFIILYITFFVYLFDKKTEGLIIIFLFILTFFAGFKTISDLYNLNKDERLVKFDFLLDYSTTRAGLYYDFARYMIRNPLPLWIFAGLPISLSIISLLLIVLTVSYIKKTKKNTTFGDIPFERKPRKLLDDYKGLFISNFVFLIVFILGIIGLNYKFDLKNFEILINSVLGLLVNFKILNFALDIDIKIKDDIVRNIVAAFLIIIAAILSIIPAIIHILKMLFTGSTSYNDITIDFKINNLQLYLSALYIIIFIISWVMLSYSRELFQMRTNQLFADG